MKKPETVAEMLQRTTEEETKAKTIERIQENIKNCRLPSTPAEPLNIIEQIRRHSVKPFFEDAAMDTTHLHDYLASRYPNGMPAGQLELDYFLLGYIYGKKAARR